jgi:membrane protease YdiL (CAAX protease family)
MTAGSIFLGQKYGVLDQFLNSPLNLQASLPYMGAMVGLFMLSTALAEVLPSFKDMKILYQKTLIPQLKEIPIWGLAVMAAGAGIGEEALFRGVLQNWVIEQVGTIAPIADYAVVLGVFSSSFVFGLAHFINPAYLIFAFAAGCVFGVQYLNCGLPAAAVLHAVYDFIAFIVIIQYWGNDSTDKNSINNDLVE